MNQYISSTINYTEGDCIDSNKIASWLSIDSEMKIKIDENMIKEYVETLAAKYNTAEQEQDFRTISGRMVQVYSDYGWKIDQEKETQQILSDIKTGNPQNRELCYSIQSFTHENNGLGKTYVEIDSYNNKLYYVKDGQLVFDMDCLMGQEMDEVLELKQKRKDTLSLFDLNCLAVRYEQRSGFLSSFADNSTDTDYDNDKNKILSLSEGIYLHKELARVSSRVEFDTKKANDVLTKLNAQRKSEGLSSLSMDTSSEAYKLACIRAADMAIYDYSSSTSPMYGTLNDMCNLWKISSSHPSENIWKAPSKTADEIHSRFQSNDGSRKIRMSNGYSNVGIAVIEKNGNTYIAEIYLS